MNASCTAPKAERLRAIWVELSQGRDLVMGGRIIVRVRRAPGGGWYWHGLRANSLSGPRTRSMELIDDACRQAAARAHGLYPEVVIDNPTPRPRRSRVLAVLDLGVPELTGVDVDLGVRVDAFCRRHLLGRLPAGVRPEDLELIRAVVEVFEQTGAWPVELAGEGGR